MNYSPRHIIKQILSDRYAVFFVLALCVYAWAGSPTPDRPGLTEGGIAALLFLSVGGMGGLAKIWHVQSMPMIKISLLLALYGISIPLIHGLGAGHDVGYIIRDLVGFCFVLLPLIYYQFFKKDNKGARFLALYIGIGAIALLFSARVAFGPVSFLHVSTSELLYLANSPLVLLICFYLPFWAIDQMGRKECLSIERIAIIIGALGVFCIIFMALMVDTQRAPIAALGMSAVILSAALLWVRPKFFLILSAFAFIMSVCLYEELYIILEPLVRKTVLVGGNMRSQELIAIWEALYQNPIHILIGSGWGGSFSSPAVGGYYVTYSHSLISYVFFKMGLVGLAILAFYLWHVTKMLYSIARHYLIWGNALFWALIIPVFFYASHKSFDFGLLLVVILVSYQCNKKKINEPYA